MIGRRITITIIVLSVCALCFCQHTDRQLTMAYLDEDMQTWRSYLEATDWESSSRAEQERILLYEYGYIPYLMDNKDTAQCRRYFSQYKAHIEALSSHLPPAVDCAHRSAAHAYAYMLGDGGLKDALLSIRYARQAMQNDSLNPLALHLRASVYFYAPHIAGGSKRKALNYYQQAEQRAATDSVVQGQWLYPAAQLGVAQCYHALKDDTNAVLQCRRIQQQHPTFRYVNEVFLPRLTR